MTEYRSGNIFIRDNGGPHPVGWTLEGHLHNFHHTSYCGRGRYEASLFKGLVDQHCRPIDGKGNDIPLSGNWLEDCKRLSGEQQFVFDKHAKLEPGSFVGIAAFNKHSFKRVDELPPAPIEALLSAVERGETSAEVLMLLSAAVRKHFNDEWGTMHCLYSHRDPQTHEVVQEWNGWHAAAA